MSSYFARPEIADQMVLATAGINEFSDASSGLFIAAPRRTGKTTFLRGDLIPAFERAGVLPVYVDLWASQGTDPFDLVSSRIARALATSQGLLAKTKGVAAAIASVVTINGVNLNLNDVGKTGTATLADALAELGRACGKPVALIIDEAQHALTSERGSDLMFALKSARDQMNMPGRAMLRLVMSGSDRDKLLRLVNTAAAPFFGAAIKPMPVLDRAYIEHVAANIERAYESLKPVNRGTLEQAFALFASRPEPFIKAYREALDPTADLAGVTRFEDRVIASAKNHLAEEAAAWESLFLGLSEVEQAVVARMLEMQDTYRPMDAAALDAYSEYLGRKVNTNQVNTALQSLRQNTPPLVWKSNHGEYALADSGMDRWYQDLKAAGAWPPVRGKP